MAKVLPTSRLLLSLLVYRASKLRVQVVISLTVQKAIDRPCHVLQRVNKDRNLLGGIKELGCNLQLKSKRYTLLRSAFGLLPSYHLPP